MSPRRAFGNFDHQPLAGNPSPREGGRSFVRASAVNVAANVDEASRSPSADAPAHCAHLIGQGPIRYVLGDPDEPIGSDDPVRDGASGPRLEPSSRPSTGRPAVRIRQEWRIAPEAEPCASRNGRANSDTRPRRTNRSARARFGMVIASRAASRRQCAVDGKADDSPRKRRPGYICLLFDRVVPGEQCWRVSASCRSWVATRTANSPPHSRASAA